MKKHCGETEGEGVDETSVKLEGDFYNHVVIDSGLSTYWIGDSTYYSTNGVLNIRLPYGNYPLNGTNENTWDAWQSWGDDYYTGLTRPEDDLDEMKIFTVDPNRIPGCQSVPVHGRITGDLFM